MFEFSRKTLFSFFGKTPLKAQNYCFFKILWGGMGPFAPPPGYAYVEAGGITGLHRHFLQLH